MFFTRKQDILNLNNDNIIIVDISDQLMGGEKLNGTKKQTFISKNLSIF